MGRPPAAHPDAGLERPAPAPLRRVPTVLKERGKLAGADRAEEARPDPGPTSGHRRTGSLSPVADRAGLGPGVAPRGGGDGGEAVSVLTNWLYGSFTGAEGSAENLRLNAPTDTRSHSCPRSSSPPERDTTSSRRCFASGSPPETWSPTTSRRSSWNGSAGPLSMPTRSRIGRSQAVATGAHRPLNQRREEHRVERMQGTDTIHPETGIPAEITFSDRLTDSYADEIRRS